MKYESNLPYDAYISAMKEQMSGFTELGSSALLALSLEDSFPSHITAVTNSIGGSQMKNTEPLGLLDPMVHVQRFLVSGLPA